MIGSGIYEKEEQGNCIYDEMNLIIWLADKNNVAFLLIIKENF